MSDTGTVDSPETLADIAALLDKHAAAIDEARAELAECERKVQDQIATHEESVRSLATRQAELMRASFDGILSFESPTLRRRAARTPAKTRGGVPPNIAARQRNAAMRRFAKEHGLAVPETGNDFSPELVAAFDREAGYQG